MITVLKDVLINIISRFGYLGLFGIMTLDACFVPLQSEISLPLAGFLASEGKISAFIVVLVGALGNTFGAYLMHLVGSKLSEKRILKLIERYGRFVLLKQQDYLNVKKMFRNKGMFFIFLGRMLPGIRSVMSLPAGVLKIPLIPFLLFTFLGSTVWASVLVFMGYKLGENWLIVEEYISRFENFVIAGLLLLIVLYVWRKLRAK